MLQQTTTRVIIKKDDKVLLIRRSGGNPQVVGKYELPGGKVDFGEEPELALAREVQEELGLELQTSQLQTVQSFVDPISKKQYILIVYLGALLEDAKIHLSGDHDKYKWVKLSELQLEELSDMTKLVLNVADQPTPTEAVLEQRIDTVAENTSPKPIKYTSVIIYGDGGSRGNPGPSASGFVIMTPEEEIIYEGGEYLGITTNNQAEYHAVRFGLEKARQIGARRVQFRLDSLLVVNQMTGVYQIKNRDLWPIHAGIKELMKEFESVKFTHVRREFNKLADGMVNQILDKQAGIEA